MAKKYGLLEEPQKTLWEMIEIEPQKWLQHPWMMNVIKRPQDRF
ncbi:hypothetical Protein YC6258_02727 [Gynuella sunshinyii YC6258]|uniref:Uncharacterized protein n=1 Tax=Gynuella sunshinyii YC6258 TaxID=1445510 RepID=A0A0C5V5R7_9GAMM|nr:hypothetical Protein YC6258_02727 [Gynuella sunshinyii YC6258]